MPPLTLDQALANVRSYASGLFQTALSHVNSPPAPPSSPPSQAQQAAEQLAHKELAKWQGQMTTALKQLDQAEDIAAKQRGRESFTAIAQTTKNVCVKIDQLISNTTSDTATNSRLHALAEVLTSLAALAPADWKATSNNDNNGSSSNGGA